jgi:hypothetical protein
VSSNKTEKSVYRRLHFIIENLIKIIYNPKMYHFAGLAKLADAPDLGSGG